MNQSRNIETIVGSIIIVCCFVMMVMVYNRGFFSSSSPNDFYTLNASFEKVDGINIGNDVMISGVKVGEVKSKKLDNTNYNAVLEISIEKDLKLPIDTSAEIVSASLMGDKYISLVPGAETDLLKDGDTIEFTQSSISIEGLITKFVFGLDNSKDEASH
jgi:phospholipid/cholesterol/gamma-HCH transport system substrate-binding protein